MTYTCQNCGDDDATNHLCQDCLEQDYTDAIADSLTRHLGRDPDDGWRLIASLINKDIQLG